jgi:hypothetical protein
MGKYFFFPFERFYVARLGTAVPSLATTVPRPAT